MTGHRRRSLLLLMAGATFVIQLPAHPEAGPNAGSHEYEEHDYERHGTAFGHHDETRVVSVSAEVMEEFGIVTAPAGPGILRHEVVLPGEVLFSRAHHARLSARYRGIVRERSRAPGDAVRKGEVVAIVESTESLQAVPVRAPFDGVVLDSDVVPGEVVEAGRTLLTVADLSTLWVEFRIYGRDLESVRAGLPVLVSSGNGELRYRGVIDYVAPTIDPHTRTGLARVVIEAASSGWKPGLFVRGHVSLGEHRPDLLVPRSAVMTMEGQEVVFVRTEDGFEARAIVTGRSDSESVEVRRGLETGEIIAVRHVLSLKAELEKASFGGHEGHVH